jgi:hypothetical protein
MDLPGIVYFEILEWEGVMEMYPDYELIEEWWIEEWEIEEEET